MRDRLIELIDDFIHSVDVSHWYSEELDEKLADHLLANGVIVPPVSVGQTVYVVSRYYTGNWEIFECKVDEITMYKTHIFLTLLSVKGNFKFGYEISSINKDVFFAEEEAQKRAKELRK